MTTFATDRQTRDFQLDKFGNLLILSDAEALAGIITNVLRVQRGELQYDVSAGIPYFETVFSGRANIPLWKGFMISAIEAVEGVLSVDSFDASVSGNILSYLARISTVYGEVSANG